MMTLDGKILDILFRRIPPEKLLRRINARKPNGRNAAFCPTMKEYKDWFLSVAETNLSGYSLDEQESLYQEAEHSLLNPSTAKWEYCNPPFRMLADYGDRVLERRGDKIFCKFRWILDWRETYLCLGQDIVVTAWLAWNAVPGWKPPRYCWPSILPSNNRNLDCILREEEGIAENHYHLYGSAAVFALNWSRLMTWPDIGNTTTQWLEENLQAHLSRGTQDARYPMRDCLLYAAWIRSILFRHLEGENIPCLHELRCFDSLFEGQGKRELFSVTDILRHQYGLKFLQQHPRLNYVKPCCLDYAFTRYLIEEVNQHFRILAGERHLLFRCFRACFTNQWNTEMQWIFYLYLLIKAHFREEIIQVNRQTGFRNFQNYEKRKYLLWDLPGEIPGTGAYWHEALRTAVVAPLQEQPIRSLEVRLTPRDTEDENLEYIYSLDRDGLFYRYGEKLPRKSSMDWEISALRNPCSFYVLHFIKEKDSPLQTRDYQYRHKALREKTRRQAVAIVRSLSQHDYLRRRIRGIDACANEIGCRPEVFAVPFRFLQSCPIWLYQNLNIRHCQEHLSLSATYHAGEDFRDVADGLRTIDEAVCFLNLRRGSRIGHALALGVNPEVHYRRKHGYIVLPKQELLDNLTWLFFRSAELNIAIEPNLKERIRNQAEDLLTEIYRKHLFSYPKQGGGIGNPSLRDYYRSWMLRGDDPICYADPACYRYGVRSFKQPEDELASFAFNQWPGLREILEHCRRDGMTAGLYHAYHYSRSVKQDGSKTIQFRIFPDYIRLMERMQRGLQKYLNDLGFGIECNPSSNALIGTFKEYESHPIFQFYDLSTSSKSISSPLHVSLNTDDQGVFDTSLTFEYTLVAAALTSRKHPDGTREYTDREVEDYIRNLRRMGNEQTFPKCDDKYKNI